MSLLKLVPTTTFITLLVISYGASASTIKAGCIDKMEPFCYQINGVGKGMIIDVYEALSDRLGRPINIHIAPVKRAMNYLESGQYDILMPLLYSPERDKFARYLTVPLFSFRSIIFGTKKDYFLFTQISDLWGKKVGVRRGYYMSNEFTQSVSSGDIEVVYANSDRQLVGLLAKGRVQYIATPDHVVVVHRSLLSDQFISYGYLTETVELRAALSRSGELNDHYTEIDKILGEMSNDGTLAEIAKRHKIKLKE
ncbi:transporter substrate-binding domain-containing protein [Vibrio profundum]|uniref:substrate-binding periplasmic protein n=1 Tax=Vibrio profundum TaxID=2910247 RepID=UPI003D12C94D